MIVVTSGCSYREDEFENSILSYKIPENWVIVDVTLENSVSGLKPVGSNRSLIDITSTDVSPHEVVDGYINNYPREYPRFQVIKKETVTVDGEEGTELVYKNTCRDDVLLIGPDCISAVVAFSKYNKTYIISSDEVLENEYHTIVEPAMNTIVKSLKIKDSSF